MVTGSAHVNPAITLMVWIHGGITRRALLARVAAQVAGATVAAVAVSDDRAGEHPWQAGEPAADLWQLLVAALLMTGLTTVAVFEVLPGRARAGRYGAGAVAGSIVVAATVVLSGATVPTGTTVTTVPATAALNPAAAGGLAVAGVLPWAPALAMFSVQLLAIAVAAVAVRPLGSRREPAVIQPAVIQPAAQLPGEASVVDPFGAAVPAALPWLPAQRRHGSRDSREGVSASSPGASA